MRPDSSLFTALAALAFASAALAQQAEYGIREDQPRTGSAIRAYAVRGSAIAINKRYDQLTPQEKEVINGWYERIGPGDEPPFPQEGMRPIHEALLKAQAKLRVTGELYLFATVDAKGEVASIKLVGNPDPEMTRFAASVLLLTRFKPALCSGSPCSMDFPLRYQFVMQ